jgi:hypothetical protein
MTSGYVYPKISSGSYNSEGVVFQKLPIGNADEKTFTLVASNSTATRWVNIINTIDGTRTGKHRLEFDLVLNSGSISSGFSWNYTDNDDDPYTGNGYGSSTSPTVGHNSFDFEIFNDGVGATPHVFFQIDAGSTFDISVTNLKLTHNYEEITVDRTADSGGRTMTATTPLSDGTTEMQVTVTGTDSNGNDNSSLSGTYTRPHSTSLTWNQVGGDGAIYRQVTGGGFAWSFIDGSDGTPSFSINVAENVIVPWQVASSFASNNVTLSSVEETITVDRSSDRKGESRPLLSKVVGGATAAYSLRDLNDKQGNNKVVRVRRASDNHERDFLAKEVSNGTLQNWVNTQTVLPLDLQALTADGRTGAVIPAKAAYSLRNLSKNYTGNVVDVRRSSDDTVQGFTADEVADGTLEDWVNTEYALLGGDYSSLNLNSAAETNLGGGSYRMVNSTAGSGGVQKNISRTFLKTKITVNVTSLTKGSLKLQIGEFSNHKVITSTGVHSYEVIPNSIFVAVRPSATEETSADFTITSITQTASNGHVKTWYDQSGNSRDAVQATSASQPLIVDGGSLVTNNGIDFDGSQFLQADSVSGMGSTISMIAVSMYDSGSAGVVSLASSASGSTSFGIIETSSKSNMNAKNTDGLSAQAVTSGTTRLTFGTTTGQTSTKAASLGGNFVENTNDYGDDFTAGELDRILIGKLRVSSGTLFNGRIREAIIYDTDQSDNRTALEANIGEAYNITGIPAHEDTVDGFVETWYDQSGNGNDAVQQVSGSQPKIVNAGSLVKDTNGHPEIDFDGAEFLLKTAFTQGDLAQANTIFSVGKLNVAADTNRKLYDGTLHNKRNMLFLSTNGSGEFAFFADDVISTGVTATNDKKLFSALFNGASSELFIDGASGASGDVGDYPMSGVTIGKNHSGDLNFWLGQIQEIVIYNSDQSANRPAIEANINNQYDIY